MKKPELFLYLSMAALASSLLSWFVDIAGLVLAVPVLMLTRNELKKSALKVSDYSLQEIKHLKIARTLSIVSIIVSALIIAYGICILVLVTMGFLGY